MLANTPITIDDKIADQLVGSDKPTSEASEKATADRPSSENSDEPSSGQTGTPAVKTESAPEQAGGEKPADVKAADKSDQ